MKRFLKLHYDRIQLDILYIHNALQITTHRIVYRFGGLARKKYLFWGKVMREFFPVPFFNNLF